MTFSSNAAATSKAVVGLIRRKDAGDRVLEMLEDKEDSWFERLEDDSHMVK